MPDPETVSIWADQEMLLTEALRHLAVRAQTRCDRPQYWSLLDVGAVRAITRRAVELGFLEESA